MRIGIIRVGRWQCPICLSTFRHLPPFLEPHKRYMTCTQEEVASRVLTKNRQRYEDAVKRPPPNRQSFIYACGDGSSMSRSSCWRWITWMAGVALLILTEQPEVATASSLRNAEQDGHVFAQEQARSKERFEELHLARRLHLSGRMKDPIGHRQRNRMF